MNIMRQSEYSVSRRRRCRMWLAVAACLGYNLMLAAATTPAKSASDPEWHAFTDAQGHTLNAQVQSLVGATANLKREDGTTFTAPLAAFSKSDQAYIIETMLRQRLARGETIFEISAAPQKSAQAPTTHKITGGTQLNWQESYRVVLKNQTLQTLADLQVRTIAFKALLLPAVPGAKTTPILLLGQTFDLTQSPPHSETPFLTEPYDMEQILANDGGFFPDAPAVHAETDKLVALWVRVYDSNGFLVQEWCTNPALMKQQTWDAAWKEATGQSMGQSSSPAAAPARETRGGQSGVVPGLPNPFGPASGARGTR